MLKQIFTSFVFGLAAMSMSISSFNSQVLAVEAEVPYEAKAMETLGATLVAYSLDAHVNVGLISDSYQGEVIDEERAKGLTNLVIAMLDQVGPPVVQLTKYEECGEEDKQCFVTLAKIFKAIKAEAVALNAYIESGEDSDLEAFQEKNQAAQAEIDALLNASK